MNAERIKQIVDMSIEGVSKSCVGDVFYYPDTDDIRERIMHKQLNQPAFVLVQIIVTVLMKQAAAEVKECGNI